MVLELAAISNRSREKSIIKKKKQSVKMFCFGFAFLSINSRCLSAYSAPTVFLCNLKLGFSEEKMPYKQCICYIVTRCLNIERKMEQKKGAQ